MLSRNQIIIATLCVLLLIAVGLGGYYYYQSQFASKTPTAQQELQATIDAVAKLMVLPEGETPTLATVADPEKLRDQAFFNHAKKGDKVLIFTTSHKAILYDPVANKIVEVAPVNLGAADTPAPTPPAPTPKK